MKFGINIAPSWDSWKLVKRAEELGFHYASFIDSQLINADMFVCMTAAAMKTDKIHLGTGVIIPSNRLAPVAAGAIASLNAIAGGRIHMGVGTGFTGRRTMGLGPIKLADMFDWIEVVENLLAGKAVDAQIEGAKRTIRFMNPELELINITDRVPITVSALGPRGRRMVAERGYAWTNTVGNLERAEVAIADMKAAWKEAGRDLSELLATANCGGTVLAKPDDWDAEYVRAEAGPSSAIILHNLAEEAEFGSIGHKPPPELARLVEEYIRIYENYEPKHARYLANHKSHLMAVRPEEQHLITGDFIRASTLSGTKEEIRDKIRSLKEMGYTTFTTHVRTVLPEMVEKWADVIEGI
ncbi:MAG: LLM class flavin-dependent oxidoreductase [Pseudomonadota bacterium]|nr:LLM class flavin-dependent oxidoreductase [Pseudomonadota bacterium]